MTPYVMISTPCPASNVLIQSLEGVRDAIVRHYILDKQLNDTSLIDLQILTIIEEIRPKAVFFVPTVEEGYVNPSSTVFEYIRRKFEVPVVQFYLDLAKPFWRTLSEEMSVHADLAVSIECSKFSFSGGNRAKTLTAWTPAPPFAETAIEKNIDVSLIGTLGPYYPERQEAVDYLKDAGIEVMCGGGVHDYYNMSLQLYFEILGHSKIVINFSAASNNVRGTDKEVIHHVKGRVFEAIACRALLLESKNDVTANWFRPSKEFVSFDSNKDLLTKIHYYLANSEKRLEIAENGYNRYFDEYRAEIFWNRILERLEQPNPPPVV